MNIERIKLYNQFVDLMIKSIGMSEQDRKIKPKLVKQLGIELQTIGLKMIVVSSDSVVEKFIKWRAIAQEGGNPEAVFKSFAEALIEIRSELLNSTERTIGDVLDILS